MTGTFMTGSLRLAALALLLAIAACGTEPATAPGFTGSLTRPGSELDRQLATNVVSEFRRGQGLGSLTQDPKLNELAEQQARAMAAAGKLSHDVGGRGLRTRLDRAGYKASAAGENIAAGHDTLMEVFGDWRASPSHRSTMLNREATHMGIAAVQAPGSSYRIFWALIVAKPEG
jgi:uncharacterized protein YkwD